VIGAETMSRVLDWQDRSTCILFGDGAGAVVLQGREEVGGVLSSVLRSDGSGGDLLCIPSVGSIDVYGSGFAENGHKMHKMYMAGSEVFKFATRVIGESIREAVAKAGIELQDLSLIVPHQANLRIIQAAARSLDLDQSLFMCNVDRYGNTSAASIPIALVEALEQGRIHEGDHIAMVGFGGGLTWAAMVVQWSGRPLEETRFGTQRRRFSYLVSAYRTRLRKISRRYRDMIDRVRPNYGRMQRLRRKIDQSEIL
jgi:3-oxoacyl-[acyl-carrier-protein] synthase III